MLQQADHRERQRGNVGHQHQHDVLELRIALEAESAALAAERRQPPQLVQMRKALTDANRAIAAGEDAVESDLAFHRAVAEATGNRHFTSLFSTLGALLIPRARVQTFRLHTSDRQTYLQRVKREHQAIYQAVLHRNPEAARAAMRQHLGNSRERLQRAAALGGD